MKNLASAEERLNENDKRRKKKLIGKIGHFYQSFGRFPTSAVFSLKNFQIACEVSQTFFIHNQTVSKNFFLNVDMDHLLSQGFNCKQASRTKLSKNIP